jgi:hypothetical protein
MTIADNFEAEKNVKASIYTLVICVALLLILLFVKWTLAAIPPPPEEEGIEVNLGNSDQGLGDDQPFLPGKPAPADQQAYTPPKVATAPVEDVKDFETDDKDADAPVVRKPPVTKPNATKVPEKDVVKTPAVRNPQPTNDPPAPAPPKPKAVFRGVNGTGTGGNEADNYKKGGNEGIAGGRGDQGAPGGNPESDNYKGGGTGNSGVAKLRGLTGRSIIRTPSFEDDFNENAKVAVDVRIDAAGNVISAEYQPRGSTTSDPNLKAIALRKAKQVKFNPGSDESTGTLQFNFRLKS